MRILLLRDPHRPFFFDIVTQRLRDEPGVEVDARSLLDPLPDLKSCDLCVFLLLDPCDNRPIWPRALAVADHVEYSGIPVFQHPRGLPNARKSTFLSMIGESDLGVRVARAHAITNFDAFFKDFAGLSFPLFVRENDYHSGDLRKVDTPDAARAQRREIEQIPTPVAVEYIETARDGLYRKFRYVVAGDRGCPCHLQVTSDWASRGDTRLFSPEVIAAERDFVCSGSDPIFIKAARALGLDYGAFDYTYDHEGRMVMWEINPAPSLQLIGRWKKNPDGEPFDMAYRNGATSRVLDTVAAAYRDRARSG